MSGLTSKWGLLLCGLLLLYLITCKRGLTGQRMDIMQRPQARFVAVPTQQRVDHL